MQKLTFKASQRVINIQKFIIQSLPETKQIPHLVDVMMELALREANNSENNVLEDMAIDMININDLDLRDRLTRQHAYETVCGAYHLTQFYNGLYEIMLHLDTVFYHIKESSVEKYRRQVIQNDIEDLDVDLTNIATLWFGSLFAAKVDQMFDKYILHRQHSDTIFGNRWIQDLNPISQQMKIRSILLLILSVMAASYEG